MAKSTTPRLTRQQILEGLDKLINAESGSKLRIEQAMTDPEVIEGTPRQRDLAEMLIQVTFNLLILTSARKRI